MNKTQKKRYKNALAKHTSRYARAAGKVKKKTEGTKTALKAAAAGAGIAAAGIGAAAASAGKRNKSTYVSSGKRGKPMNERVGTALKTNASIDRYKQAKKRKMPKVKKRSDYVARIRRNAKHAGEEMQYHAKRKDAVNEQKLREAQTELNRRADQSRVTVRTRRGSTIGSRISPKRSTKGLPRATRTKMRLSRSRRGILGTRNAIGGGRRNPNLKK